MYTQFIFFTVLRVPQVWETSVLNTRVGTHKNIRRAREPIRSEILVFPIKSVRLHIRSQHRLFLLSCWPPQRFRRIQSSIYSMRMKRFREAFLTSSSQIEIPASEDKQQTHLHLCGLGCYRRYDRTCMLFNAEWTFDSSELK